MRPFVEKTNRDLTARIGAEVKSLFPIVSADGKSTLSVSDVSIDTSKFDPSDLNAQQKAREQGLTRAVPIFGQLSLTRDGKVIQKRKIKLGELPLMNDLTTYSVQGNDWFTPLAQLRLKSGAYTREKANGLFETFIRTQGRPMTVWMDPAKGNFKFGYGTTNVSLYSVLREMGAADADIIAGLGGDDRARALLSQNRGDASERDIPRLYEAVLGSQANKHLIRAGVIPDTGTETDRAAQGAALQGFFTNRTVLDPFVTRHTLGKPFEHVDRDMLLASAKRILDVYRGDAEPDDRDAPEYKKAFGIEDLMAERLRRFKNSFTRVVQRRLGREDTLGSIIPHDWLNPATVGYFGGAKGVPGGLASTAEAANPLAILSEGSKLTLRGDGGIQSDHAITMGARMFRPTALNFVDPVRSPEGSNIGVTTHAAFNVIREGQQLKAPFLKCTDGKVDASTSIYISVEQAADSVIGYPEEWDFKTGKPTKDLVRAVQDGRVSYVKPEEVDYIIPSGMSMFDFTSNAALFLAHTHPNRAMMAGKHLTQALPLVNREKPLVGLKDPFSGKDMLAILGRSFVIRSNVDGKVDQVSDTAIVVDGVKHTLFNQYPMQAKVALHHIPVVKVGDTVKKGQLLADSNYSRDGSLALGVNLRSAYMPWKNAGNFEDAIAISETGARKLTSEHVHREKLMLDDDMIVGTSQYAAQFPTQLTQENAKKLNEGGFIKAGSTVQPGELLVAAVRKRKYDPEDRSSQNLGRIHKSLLRPWMDAGLRWEEDFPGTVLRVLKLSDHIEVHLLTHEPAQIGDKLSMSSAAKGTISTIIPDDKAPVDKKGRPIEIILNPIGVLGRINPSQTVEELAGKLVRDGGVPYSFANFDNINHPQVIEKALKRAGLSREEILFDPEEGRDIERPVATGYNYVFKLDHPVRKKFSARGRDGYTMDEAPSRGKGKGGQAFDHLTTYALLGHNAHAILRESFGVRGTKNDDYWLAYQTGERPPPPKVPFVFERFRAMLTAAGVDTKQHGNVLHYMPITDKRVMEMSNGAIQNALHVRAKDLKEEKGGLFDPVITGGNKGTEWAHIDLGWKIPHPMYEKVLRDVLGLKQSEMYGLIAETLWYDPKVQKFFTEDGPGRMTGEKAFEHLLDFDVDDKLSDVKARLKTAVGSDFNRLHRSSRYLRGLKDTKMRPADAYLSSKVPVLPPMYRSVTEMRRGELRVDPSNLLYRDIILARDLINQAEKDKTLPGSELGKARLALYDGYAALVGVGKSLTDRRDEEVPGFVDIIRGKTNKQGLFQRQLSRRRNDFTGRSTIEPDANLGVDEIGIPESMAWKMYEPTLVRRMVQGGWLPADAVKQVAGQTVAARNVLQTELEQRPVLYSRAPSLHKWNVMAAMPHMTSGQEIKISPLVVGPNNADYDGDQQIGVVLLEHPATMKVGGSPMAARFRLSLPLLREGCSVSVVDLADFPRGEVRGVKETPGGRIAFFAAAPGLRVLAYDAQTAQLAWAPVDGWSEHYGREVEIVTLSSGYQIITDDDPRAIYGLDVETLEEHRCTPSEAGSGIMIPRQTRLTVPEGEMTYIETAEYVEEAREGTKPPWRLPGHLSLTPAFGYLLGAYLGNGRVSGNRLTSGEIQHRQVSFSHQDSGVRDAVQRAVEDLLPGIRSTEYEFSASEEGRLGAASRDTYSAIELARLLYSLCGTGAATKHLPPWYLAAPLNFRKGLFAGLMDTDGTIAVSQAAAKNKPQLMGAYTSISLRMSREIRLLANSLGIRGRITGFRYKKQNSDVRDQQAWQLSFSTVDMVQWAGNGMSHQKRLKFAGVTCEPESAAAARADILPLPSSLAMFFRTDALHPYTSLYSSMSQKRGRISRVSARRLVAILTREVIEQHPLGPRWLKIVDNDQVTWDYVEAVEKTGQVETGYDLTVPGFETFTSIDGVVLSNTMMVHVPMSEEARLESYKMLPSNNLFYDRDRSLAYGPEKDVIAGVFALTRPGRATGLSFKTTQDAIDAYKVNKSNLRMDSMVRVSGYQGTPTIGQLIFLNVIPARFQAGLTFPIDRKKMDALLTRVAKESPTEYNRISRNVAMVGFQSAAMAGGITATIGELAMDRGKINQLLAAFEKQVQQRPQDAQRMYEEELRPKMEKLLDEHLAGQENGYRNIVEAGAGGSKGGRKQLLDIMLSPVLVKDENDRVIPAVIKSSYGSGMTASDYVLSIPGARAGMVAKSLSTAMPGFLAKEIAGNVGSTRVMVTDCGTHAGLTVAVEPDLKVQNYDADLLDRHLLANVASFKRNDPVTPAMLSVLRGMKVKEIQVRSPMTCEAESPPCQMCAGRAADGRLHPLGSNIGLNYGQTLGERSTQLVLRSFHSGGSIGAGDSISAGFVRLKELLSAPDVVRNQGTLSDTDGMVNDIRPAPQGGWYVMVDKDEHYVAPGRALKVKQGQRVQKGDPLSDGTYRPQELAAKKGLLAAQQYVVDETRKAYQQAGAVMRRPVIEVVTAATMRNMEVLDDGGEKDLAPGDVMHENEFKRRQRSNSALTGRPVIPGLSRKPLLTSNDLMERLNFQRLEDTMHEVPASAGRSDLLGTKSPIPGLAYGAMFRNDEITSPFAKRAELEEDDDP